MRYDTLVVGGGPAGLVVAARLSEDSTATIALIEAGPDVRVLPPALRTPNFFHVFRPEITGALWWRGLTIKRTPAQVPATYRSGHGIGGSSNINGMLALRGMAADFDRWEELGCRGWSAAGVLASFVRSETDVDFGDAPYHGRHGPMVLSRVSETDWHTPSRTIAEAAAALGYRWTPDINAPHANGLFAAPMTLSGGFRQTVGDAYLRPSRERRNLHVLTNVLADRVRFRNGRACGITAITEGRSIEIDAEEVVLCAGAIQSPAILLRSGIGPAAHLQRLGIEVIADRSGVGRNLLDHSFIPFSLPLRESARMTDDGRWSECGIRYDSGHNGCGPGDMMMVAANSDGPPPDGLAHCGVAINVHQVHSRGRLLIRTSDPLDAPEINACLLSDRHDLVRMCDGVRRTLALLNHPSMSAIADGPVTPQPPLDEKSLETWVEANCRDGYHAAGTCRMGAENDGTSVVDPSLAVLGTRGLSVVDASVMPDLPRANILLATIMIAEKFVQQRYPV